jgi:hypothetical protein
MKNAKRWYIYFTSGISLHVFVWGLIGLLRLSTSTIIQTTDIAFQFSIIIISLPVFIVHYRWAKKLADEYREEISSEIRSLFHYLMLIAFLSPLLTNLYTLLSAGILQNESIVIRPSLIAIFITGIGYGLIYKQILTDREILGTDENMFFKRIFILIANLVSIIATATATTRLLIFTFLALWKTDNSNDGFSSMLNFQSQYESITLLVISVTSLVIFWKWLQRLLHSSKEEQASIERKIYLYLVVLASAVTTVSILTAILAGIFRKWMGLDPDGDIRRILPSAIVGGIVWAFHSHIINRDDAQYGTITQQRGIKIIYLYLMASVGLMAFVIGVGGNLNTIFSIWLDDVILPNQAKESFAYFTAAIIAGFPTWILPWRVLQLNSEENESIQKQARNSASRKNYLYFFLFLSVMVILGSAISIVYQFILLILGEGGDSDLGLRLSTSIANSLLASGVLAYHILLLKQDQDKIGVSESKTIEGKKIVIIDNTNGSFAMKVLASLKKEVPTINAIALGISSEAMNFLKSPEDEKSIVEFINNADLIVGDWTITAPENLRFENVAKTIRQSSTHKLFVPTNTDRLNWIGVDEKNIRNPITSSVKTIKDYLAGEETKISRGSGCITIIIGVFALILMLNFLESIF